ncbi:hypothetical protein V2G26_019075 [Clonostachys chloroleuca]
MISSNRNTDLRSALSLRFCLSHIVFPPVLTLAWAFGKGHIRVVRQLLNMGQFNLESRDLEDWTPLAHAAWYGHSAVVSFLADLEGVDVNSGDHLGRTPLFLAVRDGRYEVVNYLFNRAEVEQDVTDSTGKTLRMVA